MRATDPLRTFVAALEAAVGSAENEAFADEVSEGRDPSDFEARMHKHESASGFMRFHTIDQASSSSTSREVGS